MKRWPTKPLGELAESVMGQAPPGSECNFDGVGTPFVKAGEFGESRPIIREWTTKPLKFAKANDVLVCVVGATCGKLNLGTDCAIGRSVAAIRPDENLLNTGFLYAFLQGWTKRLRSGSQGSAQGVITRDMLASIPIPVPPLAEQERIVKLLDEADELRKLRAQADQRANALIPALFHEMFGDPTTNRLNLPMKELGSLCKVVGGGTPSKQQPAYWTGKIPWVSSKDMSGDEVHDSEDHISEQAIRESATNLIPASSILVVTRSGILKHTLPVAINSVPVTINQDIKAFVPTSECESTFLAAHLRALAPTILGTVRVGATVQNLETDALKRLPVLCPPLPLQKEFAQRVTEIRELEAGQATSRTRLDALFQSMLHRAFNGEL
jgi:type I restriction enzyme S subunit